MILLLKELLGHRGGPTQGQNEIEYGRLTSVHTEVPISMRQAHSPASWR